VKHPQEDLTALADGALPPARAGEVRNHLAGCEACRAELARIVATVSALAALPPAPEPSPWFATRLTARLEAEARRPSGLARFLAAFAPRWRIAVPAGLAVVAASIGLVAMRAKTASERELAAHLELLEDYELVASLDLVESPEDATLVAHLDELEGRP
jgi:anti-sigma factor RsiW